VDFARGLERKRDCYKSDVEVITKERDEARKRMMASILERERWKMRAEEKWAMRRELEELLGVESSSPCDEQFFKGIEALRQFISERDEANKELHKQLVKYGALFDEAQKIRMERDEEREALSDWENSALHVEADHPDEMHCGCVPVLRKLLADAWSERDKVLEVAK
jgi:hypothetical protein